MIEINKIQFDSEHPCIHRIHSDDNQVPESYHQLGMTIHIDILLEELENLNKNNIESGKTSFVTFDDGWNDVLMINPERFHSWQTLQPIIFLTDRQLNHNNPPLPLPRLYEWMSHSSKTLDDLEEMGINRLKLKQLSEDEQHRILDEFCTIESDTLLKEQFLTEHEILSLKNEGWWFGCHGPEHSDLRFCSSEKLDTMLTFSENLNKRIGRLPILAWPEGRWEEWMATIATNRGFKLQFGLYGAIHPKKTKDVVMRKLWR